MCPVCNNADSTVPLDDPLVPRCSLAQRLDDNTVVLGYELMLEVGQRITANVVSRMVKVEPPPAALVFRHVGLSEDMAGLAYGDSLADFDPATWMAAPVGVGERPDDAMADAGAIPSQEGSSDIEIVAETFMSTLSSQ